MDDTTHQNKKINKDGSLGPVLGILIIVILLMATALYVWGEHLNTVAQIEQQGSQNYTSTTTTIIYSTSTAPVDIQNDLETGPTIQNPGF